MKLNMVRATLVGMPPVRSTKKSGGKDGDAPVDVTEIDLGLDLGGEGDVDESFDKALADLFGPSIRTLIKNAAKKTEADEVEGGGGFDMTSREKLPELTLSLFSKYDGKRPIVKIDLPVTVRSRAKLKVDAKGDATLCLRRVASRIEFEDVAKLIPYLNGTIFVTTEPVAPTLPGTDGSPPEQFD